MLWENVKNIQSLHLQHMEQRLAKNRHQVVLVGQEGGEPSEIYLVGKRE